MSFRLKEKSDVISTRGEILKPQHISPSVGGRKYSDHPNFSQFQKILFFQKMTKGRFLLASK
jgi:hypothetical protein